jgi:hypothetical protein
MLFAIPDRMKWNLAATKRAPRGSEKAQPPLPAETPSRLNRRASSLKGKGVIYRRKGSDAHFIYTCQPR